MRALRRAVSDVNITTDLIAGFPGETEADFAATLDLVREAAFDAAYTFVFSPRSGTAAADLPDQISDEVRRERVGRLIALTQELALASRRASKSARPSTTFPATPETTAAPLQFGTPW